MKFWSFCINFWSWPVKNFIWNGGVAATYRSKHSSHYSLQLVYSVPFFSNSVLKLTVLKLKFSMSNQNAKFVLGHHHHFTLRSVCNGCTWILMIGSLLDHPDSFYVSAPACDEVFFIIHKSRPDKTPSWESKQPQL